MPTTAGPAAGTPWPATTNKVTGDGATAPFPDQAMKRVDVTDIVTVG